VGASGSKPAASSGASHESRSGAALTNVVVPVSMPAAATARRFFACPSGESTSKMRGSSLPLRAYARVFQPASRTTTCSTPVRPSSSARSKNVSQRLIIVSGDGERSTG
jgi:hypothetical protein